MTLSFTLFSAVYLSLFTWLHHQRKLNTSNYIVTISLFTAFFSAYLSHDSLPYQWLIKLHGDSGWTALPSELFNTELFFLIGAKLTTNVNSFTLFFIYALLSFSLKWFLFQKTSSIPFVTLISFLALYVVYFDGTVIRASLGLAIAYWLIFILSKEKTAYYVVGIIAASFLFHFSIIIFLALILLQSHKTIKIILSAYIVLIALYVVKIDFGINSMTNFIFSFDYNIPGFNKLQSYLKSSTLSDPFSLSQIPLLIISLIVYSKYKNDFNKFEILVFNTFFLSFLVFAFFYHSQVIQGRFSEMLRFSVIFIMPYYYKLGVELIKNEKAAKLAFGSFLAIYFFYYNYVQKIIAEKNLTPIYNLIDQLKGFF